MTVTDRPSTIAEHTRQDRRSLLVAGIVLGVAQGGFFDGIVFHQLLQWHHMFSNVQTDTTIAGLEVNTIGDGLFDLFNWIVSLVGLGLLWRVMQRSTPLSTKDLIGSLLMGVGLFNLVEGVIDHHLLQIHYVKSVADHLTYDVSFLIISAFIVISGWSLVRR